MKVVLTLAVFAVAIYLVVRYLDTRRSLPAERGGHTGRTEPTARPTRPVAPDDDEDFLRTLHTDRREPGEGA